MAEAIEEQELLTISSYVQEFTIASAAVAPEVVRAEVAVDLVVVCPLVADVYLHQATHVGCCFGHFKFVFI